MSITEITDADPMRSTINHGLMVRWINASLIDRAGCDVRRSVVLYDADRLFIQALTIDRADFVNLIAARGADLYAAGVHFWSVGVK